MKNSKARIAALTMSTMMIASSFLAVSAMSASAKTEVVKDGGDSIVDMINKEANPVVDKTTKLNTWAKAYKYSAAGKTKKGYDWTYKTDKDNIKVTCKYDFKAHKYNFTLTGKSKGKANFTLMYKTNDKTWKKVPMKLTVDAKKNIMRTK